MNHMMTVEVLGVDLVVEFEGTPFIPARTFGHPDDATPAEGGEADIISVTLEGWDVTKLLNEWTLIQINEKLVEYLCNLRYEPQEELDDCTA